MLVQADSSAVEVGWVRFSRAYITATLVRRDKRSALYHRNPRPSEAFEQHQVFISEQAYTTDVMMIQMDEFTEQPQEEPPRDVMTVDEAARRLGISRSSAYEAVRSGELPAIRVGRRLLIPRVRFELWLSGREERSR